MIILQTHFGYNHTFLFHVMAIKSNMHLYFLHDFDTKIQNGKHAQVKKHNLQLRKNKKRGILY